jgi:hypothetical protein
MRNFLENIQLDDQGDRVIDRQIGRYRDTKADKIDDRHKDAQADGQIDRQTEDDGKWRKLSQDMINGMLWH